MFEPTEPQKQALPTVLRGEHTLLIAPTGTGKTEAAVLPVLDQIIRNNLTDGFCVLYITPLRALNRDMLKRMEIWAAELGLDIQVRHGDTTQYQRQKQAKHPPHMLITTPESLQAMLIGSRLREGLRNVRYVIVDEVHELADSKRGTQLAVALERLIELAGEFQRIGLSATVGDPNEVARFLAGPDRDISIFDVSMLKLLDFRVVYPKASHEDQEMARKLVCEAEFAAQIRTIKRLVEENTSTLIFVNTRQSAEALGSRFKMLNFPVGVHHGSLSREARIDAEDQFKNGELKGLICTSSMELGVDIGLVDLVIQYMSPREVNRLVQRVGRAGHRFDEVSRGAIIATDPDDIAESMVIARRASAGKIEPPLVHTGALDVLSNQICGMLLEYGEINVERLLSVVRKTYPFHELDKAELDGVLEQMAQNGLARYDANTGVVRRTGRTLHYYYTNLSMIPDERRYIIRDLVSGRNIGTLDEAFVITFAQPGAVFITRGDMWQIVDIDEDRIVVEPVSDPSGEIPSWSGEEIPVPFEVAQEVGALRERIEALAEKGLSDKQISDELGSYPADFDAIKRLVSYIRSQINKGCPVPSDTRMTVETSKRSVVVNACLGHKANETLGRVVTSLLAARFGGGVGLETDPYRIKMELPKQLGSANIRGLFMSLQPEFVEPIMEKTLRNTYLFMWKIVHVARKFGAITRDADSYRIRMERILELFNDTPIYWETIRDIFLTRLEVERTEHIVRRLHSGEIELVSSDPSPIGCAGYKGHLELLAPEHADRSIVMAVKNRIMNDRVILFCLSCQKWKSRSKVKSVPEPLVCPVCDSMLIAALKPWETDDIKAVKKKDKTKEEEKTAKRVYRNANLVLSHGKQVVIALASRGVGPENASRIIRRLRDNEEDFYRDIMEAERKYVTTRRFWK